MIDFAILWTNRLFSTPIGQAQVGLDTHFSLCLYLGTVQETGELHFSDFEKAGGGGVKKGIFTEATGEKHSRELMILFDQASGVGSNVNTFCNFRFSIFIVFCGVVVSCRCHFSDTCC